MQKCDLLLSVDTAAAHRGASAIHPAVVALGRRIALATFITNNTAYPSMRLFRQPRHGDWPGLLAQLLTALDLWRDSELI